MPPDSVPQISLLSAPSTRFDHRHKGPHFAVLPLGLENLTAALDSRDFRNLKCYLMPIYKVVEVMLEVLLQVNSRKPCNLGSLNSTFMKALKI